MEFPEETVLLAVRPFHGIAVSGLYWYITVHNIPGVPYLAVGDVQYYCGPVIVRKNDEGWSIRFCSAAIGRLTIHGECLVHDKSVVPLS